MFLLLSAFWGLTGVTQKLATNHVSAELSLLGFVTGFFPLTTALFTMSWEIVIMAWVQYGSS